MKRLWIIIFFTLLFTPATDLSMPNAAEQTPAKFKSFRQMKHYFDGIKKHGIHSAMSDGENEEMYFYRDGRRCRL